MRALNEHASVETVTAAATAMASAERRIQPASVHRRRWKAWLGMNWCFGVAPGQPTRINRAVLVPEPTEASAAAPSLSDLSQSSGLVVAPPSSPSSFLHSDPSSTIQSPGKFLSPSALTPDSYSPVRSSIFAIGPYANDTKLVSPPVFSTFTTEPSTAPFTPPEPMQLTTPSSPEVPFARFLSSSFQPYSGSPMGHIVSQGSVYSGASSPFPDVELLSSHASIRKLLPRDNSSILDGRITAIHPSLDESKSAYNSSSEDASVTFEFTAQEVAQRIAERRQHGKEFEDSNEFKFNIESGNNGIDEQPAALHSGTTWRKLNFGFTEKIR